MEEPRKGGGVGHFSACLQNRAYTAVNQVLPLSNSLRRRKQSAKGWGEVLEGTRTREE